MSLAPISNCAAARPDSRSTSVRKRGSCVGDALGALTGRKSFADTAGPKERLSRYLPQFQRTADHIDPISRVERGVSAEFESLHGGIHKSACLTALHGSLAQQWPVLQRLAHVEADTVLSPIENGGGSANSRCPDISGGSARIDRSRSSARISSKSLRQPLRQKIFIVQPSVEALEAAERRSRADALPGKSEQGDTGHPVHAAKIRWREIR